MTGPHHASSIRAATWPRRHFLAAVATAPTWPWVFAVNKAVTPSAAFDPRLEEFMKPRHIPGGALAVVKDRRLVYARGYGWADKEREIAARPETLFRVASVSKPITATAILQLSEQGRLELNAPIFTLLKLDKQGAPEGPVDPRWQNITVRQVLHHTGGWDRDRSGDPMFLDQETLAKRFPDLPAGSPWRVIRHQLTRPLDFDPGTRYAYSNFGYCLLGRVIEAVAEKPYEAFVRQTTLAPAGIQRMRLGRSLASERAPSEARYYTANGDGSRRSRAYGTFNLEAMDAHGGWIASVLDLARFATALDASVPRRLLKPASFQTMLEPPPAPVSRRNDGAIESAYYGCGWMVRPVRSGGANLWHTGSLPGTYALLMRLANGLCMAVAFNRRSESKELSDADVDPLLHQASQAVTAWPTEDLFDDNPQPTGSGSGG